jgi:SAM-dependent methyltransferase
MTSCRACRSDRLLLFLELGDHPLANGFLRPEQLAEPEPLFSLDVHVCLDCGLIQIDDKVPPEFFRHYVYIPSTAESMHDNFRGLANTVAERFLPSADSLTIDIGCNDGLFLSFLAEQEHRVLGIDPAANLAALARSKGVAVVTEYFTPELALSVRAEHGPAQVIVSTNTFHHIGNLDPFTSGIASLLADDGVFIVEVPHALELVELNQFDGVYHEHVSQLTVKSFVDHFRLFGLEVFEVEPLEIHGGSIRVLARHSHDAASVPPQVRAWIDRETEHGLFEPATYDRFRANVEQIRSGLMELLRQLKSEGRRVAAYGASARGNTLLNYCRIDCDLVEYIVDLNPLKHGLYSPGMHIPVLGVERLIEDQPDYVLLTAWNFASEIVRQQAGYVQQGGRFIVPIPEPRVIT